MPGSDPRRHDARQRLIAPRARCGTLLPPLHRCCPGDAERAGNAGDHAKLTPSTAAATTKSRRPSSVRRRQPRPAQPRPRPLPNQIPIDGKPPTKPPRVPSWGAFGRRPQHRRIGHDRPASETLHHSGLALRWPANPQGVGERSFGSASSLAPRLRSLSCNLLARLAKIGGNRVERGLVAVLA
jgi:hypothetical protein